MMKTIYKILIFFCAFQMIYAQQGILDTTFGTNGVLRITKLNYSNNLNPNGYNRDIKKFIYSNVGGNIKLGTDIETGSSIGGGKVWNKKTIVIDGVEDSSNKLYTTGFTQKEDNNKAIYVTKMKYGNMPNSTGQGYTMDETFNYDGKLVFDTKEENEESVAIKIQSDNKIVVLGFSGTKGIIIRYNTDGYLDRTFNQKGFHTFQIAQNTKPTSLAIQTDGKILVAGNCFNGNDTDFFITRLNIDGSIDSSFGTNGVVIKDVNNHDNTGNAMVLANDGSIYIGGKSYVAGNIWVNFQYSYDLSVLKYTTNGILDSSASNGVLPGMYINGSSFYQYTSPPTLVPNDEEINCMAYDNVNNRIYIYGYINRKTYDAQYNIFIRKTGFFNSCFSLDNSFTIQNSTTFQYQTNFEEYDCEVISATIKPSDMVLGSIVTPVYTVVKFSNCAYGTSTFLNTPTSTVPASCYNNLTEISFAKIQKTNDGYYGSTNYNGSGDLYKLDSNFVVDSNFGINGKIANIKEFKIDNDGKIICTGISQTNGTRTLLARFNSDGQVDYTFGTLGEIRTQNMIDTFGIYVTPENDYIVSSYKVISGSAQIILEKFLNNGEKDQAYNSSVLLSISNFSSYPSLKNSEDIISDNFGNIYTISCKQDVYDIQNQIINLAKVNSNGVFDSNFGNNGLVNLLPFFTVPTNKLNLVRLNNGKLLVYSEKRMIQFNIDGTLDTTFGNNGIIDGVTMIPDFTISKIISNGSNYFVGGYRTNGGDSSTVIKINNTGVIDTNFAVNGIYIDSNSNYLDVSYGLRNMYFDGLDKIVFYSGGIPIKRIQ